jgi:hypothetical protein
VKVANLYRREASVRLGHTQVLALTATIGGASTLDASVERIIKFEDALCCRIVSLSPAAQEELDQHTSKAAETIVDIPLCEAEVWLMQMLRTVSSIMQSTERKSEDGSAKILKEMLSILDQSAMMACSVGVARTLSFLASNFIRIKESNRESSAIRVLEFKMNSTKLFSPVSDIFGA